MTAWTRFSLIDYRGVSHWVGFDIARAGWFLICNGAQVCTDCIRIESDLPLCAGCAQPVEVTA